MKFYWKGKDWYIDGFLATQIESIMYNLKSDWDFVILVTGDRSVRIGKSIISQVIAAYAAYVGERMGMKSDYTIKDIYFDSKEMLNDVMSKPAYSINHYDEGRESLQAAKAMKSFQQDILDFFAECGQLNHLFIITLPDFFELKENIAVARSEFLINVYRKEVQIQKDIFKDGVKRPLIRLDRGYFEFFSKKKKQKLYDLAKSTRRKNYSLIRPNFIGRFTNQYTVDKKEYLKKKRESLQRFAERHEEQKKSKDEVPVKNFIVYWKKEGLTGNEVKEKMEFMLGKTYDDTSINRIFREEQEKEEIAKENEVSGRLGGNYTNKLKNRVVVDAIQL